MSKHSPNYPIGRSRLEALSVIACACIMSMASVEGYNRTMNSIMKCNALFNHKLFCCENYFSVIQYSAIDLVDGFATGRVNLDVGVWSYTILSLGIFLKIVLFLYCTAVNIKAKSDQLSALAEDHLNDGS
jgi:divalent metal cation (Fe/Co/Zn/Cd) transporter